MSKARELADLGALDSADSNLIVGDGSTWITESGETVRTSLGLSTASTAEMTAASPTSDLRAMSPSLVKSAVEAHAVGKVVQVVSNTSNTHYSTTSTSLTNSGFNLSITPTSSSSKILIMTTLSVGGLGSNYFGLGLRRNSTDLALGIPSGSRVPTTTGHRVYGDSAAGNVAMSYLDSPSTTSSITYHVTFEARSGYTTYLNRSGADVNAQYTQRTSSTITLMEIAG